MNKIASLDNKDRIRIFFDITVNENINCISTKNKILALNCEDY